jgi:Na+/proline symporter
MNQSGIPMLILVIGFGLWWVLAPESVIRFYSRMNPNRSRTPRQIRLAGLAWLILLAAMFTWIAFHPRNLN